MTAASTTPLQPLPLGIRGLRWPLLARAGAAGLLAAACLLGSGAVQALGFGRVSVESFQGQPLKAQIQVTSLSPAEQASLRLRVASPQVHQAAGLAFDDVLSSLRAELVRQSDGSFGVELRSDRPVSNVYVDLILEARWANGQRLMGYTLLVSPEGTPPPPLAQVSPVIGSGAAPAGSVGAGFAAEPVRTSDHVVKYGETLSELAQQYRPEGVSLDQMLVALYQANPQAFMGENMNRLKSGAVLKLPGAEAARAVPPVPARELIKAHSADFGAYRSRLAGQVRDAAASEPAASRQARGQVQARVQDRKDGSALTPDQLKLSQGGVRAASSPEAALSRDAAAREAAQREAELARNVQALKELQQRAGASSVAAGGQPAAPAASTDAASAPAVGPTLAMQVPAAASAAPAPAASTPAASAPAAASAASGPAAIAAGEPGWLQRLLESPFTMPGAAALVIVMALWGGYRLWRGRRDEARGLRAEAGEQEAPEPEEPEPEPAYQPVEEVAAAVVRADDLDPLAQADAHLAGGRDERAADVLRSAIEQQPDRLDLRIKLLEVLALQRDSKSYEALALEVQQMTDGQGSTWEHVTAMGREIDPYNTLYGGDQVDLAGDASDAPSPADFDTSGQPREPADLDLNGNGDADAPDVPALDVDALAETLAPDFNDDRTAAGTDNPADLGSGDAWPSEAGSEQKVEPVGEEGYGVDLGDPLPGQSSNLDQGQASDLEPAGVDLSQVDLAEPDAAGDGPSGAAPPAPVDLNRSLERKLALAKEFLEIGDMEGARDLLEEVYARATGPMKNSARLLLDSLR